MKKGNKMNVPALLYLISALIWLAAAAVNLTKGQTGYGILYVVLVVLCLILAKGKM